MSCRYPLASALISWRNTWINAFAAVDRVRRSSEYIIIASSRSGKLPTLGSHAQAAWNAFLNFDKAALADGAIPKKYKELITVAVALTTQCPFCIEIHCKAACKAGATEEELAETAFASAAIRAGGGITHATHFVQQP